MSVAGCAWLTGTVHVLQWRETRTIGDKIKGLKSELPKPDAEGNKPASPLDGEIKELEDVRSASGQCCVAPPQPHVEHLLHGGSLLGAFSARMPSLPGSTPRTEATAVLC